MDQEKDIAKIKRKIAALSNDSSLSAMAERKKLEAELAEAREELDEKFYERGLDQQGEALDKELDNFNEQKDAELEKWEKYLKDVDLVVQDALQKVLENQTAVYDTLEDTADEYGLKLTDTIVDPWKEGVNAIDAYHKKMAELTGTNSSATDDALNGIKPDLGDDGSSVVDDEKNQYDDATSAEYTPPASPTPTPEPEQKPLDRLNVSKIGRVLKKGKKGDDVNRLKRALEALGFGGMSNDNVFGKGTKKAVKAFQKKYKLTQDGSVGPKTKKKFGTLRYAKGTLGTKKDELAWIDEFGEELVIRPDGNGKLSYLTKGSGVVPADLTQNLMEWGKVDPTAMLDNSKPIIGASPSVVNKELNVNIEYGDILHIDNLNGGTDPNDIAKMVAKQFDKHTKQLNDKLRSYVR